MLTFEISYFEILRFEKYFECVRSILILYLALQTKKFVNEFELSGQLSPRQKHIYSSIQEGKSNRQIAMELSYSISLIRQETMRIYAKLGIKGRQEMRKGPQSTVKKVSTYYVQGKGKQ